MTEFRRQGQSGGGSGVSVPSNQIFDSTSRLTLGIQPTDTETST
ncbi:hypothetical protein [Vibrio cholerae]|nr:hypothetical protein [Vibrio cholerae]